MYKSILTSLIALLLALSGCNSSNRSSFPAGTATETTTNPGALSLTTEGAESVENNDTNSSDTVQRVTLQSALKMQVGDTLSLKLKITYADGHTQLLHDGVTYTSDNPEIATVDSDGVIHALAPGKATIHATYEGNEAILEISVQPLDKPLPRSLSITSPFQSVEAGTTLPLHATLQMSDETLQDVTSKVVWQSEESTICTVDEKGILNTLQSGECVIHAQYNDTAEYNATLTLTVTPPAEKVTYQCPATEQSESAYQAAFIENNISDINYSNDLLFSKLSVSEIEALFNHARASDPTVNEPMVLPPQELWDSYDASQKTLYLVNAARCARGIRPLEGIDPTLRDDVTKPYALFLTTHESQFLQNPHEADGKSPGERMADAGIVLGDNSEYYGENIAMFAIARSDHTQPIEEVEAKAVYAWLYQDKEVGYGHRKTILQTGLQDNSGKSGEEGLLAAYTAQIDYTDDQGFYVTHAYTVMDLFDPTAAWDGDLSHTERLPLYKKR